MKHFDHTHTTVAEARACEQGRGGVAVATRPQVSQERTHTSPFYRQEPQVQATPAWAANPAHPNRVKYAGDLVRKYPTETLTGEAAEAMMDLIDGKPMSAAEVDLLITSMQAIRTLVKAGTYRAPSTAHQVTTCTHYPCKACAEHTNTPAPAAPSQGEPTRAKADAWKEWRTLAAQLEAVSSHPSGARFACATEQGSDNDLAFWWVSKHERSGRYYLRQIIGGRGAVDTRLTPQAMITIAKKILAAGAYESMILFGQKIGSCGHCGRTLTNQESRDAGIGPICRNK